MSKLEDLINRLWFAFFIINVMTFAGFSVFLYPIWRVLHRRHSRR